MTSEDNPDRSSPGRSFDSSTPGRPPLRQWVVSVIVIAAAAFYFMWSLLALLGNGGLLNNYRQQGWVVLAFLIWSGATALSVAILQTSWGYRGRPSLLNGLLLATSIGVCVTVTAMVILGALA